MERYVPNRLTSDHSSTLADVAKPKRSLRVLRVTQPSEPAALKASYVALKEICMFLLQMQKYYGFVESFFQQSII